MAHRFPFVQFEFAHNIGPPEGRYIVRPHGGAPAVEAEEEAVRPGHALEAARAEDERLANLLGHADVLVLRVRSAPAARLWRTGRRSRDNGASVGEVPLVVATVIKSTEILADRGAPKTLMQRLRDDEDERERRVLESLAVVNRAVSAYRVCAADPYVTPVTRFDARIVRAGWGSNDKLKSAEYDDAVVVPEPRTPRMSRADRLMPTQGMAAVLSGSTPVLESEELLLKVLLDLDQDRVRGAAVGLRAATDLLVCELGAEQLQESLAERYAELVASGERVIALADNATRQPLTDAQRDEVAALAETAGALVDQWRYRPEDGT